MFNIGWGEILILAVAGLVILGPERLPEAMTWTMTALRQVREYATGATQQLKDEMGTDFEEFREPLEQLQKLRGMTPASIVTKHLLNGDDSFLTGSFGSQASTAVPERSASAGIEAAPAADSATATTKAAPPTMPRAMRPLTPGERPPIDPDAT